MKVTDLRPLVEPDLLRKRLEWNNVAYIEFFPLYYEVTLWIRGFDGNIMYNPLKDDGYKQTIRFEYKESNSALVEDQSLQEQSGEEAPSGRGPSHRGDRAPGDGDASGSTRTGPGDGREAEAGPEAPSEEAEAHRGACGHPGCPCGYCVYARKALDMES